MLGDFFCMKSEKKPKLDPVLLEYPLISIGDIVEWQHDSLMKLTRKQKKILSKLDAHVVALFLDQRKGEILLGTATGENIIQQQQKEEMDPSAPKRDNTIFQRAAAEMAKENS